MYLPIHLILVTAVLFSLLLFSFATVIPPSRVFVISVASRFGLSSDHCFFFVSHCILHSFDCDGWYDNHIVIVMANRYGVVGVYRGENWMMLWKIYHNRV